MKKILTLLLACTLFAACGDDDNNEPEKPYFNPVEGKWVNKPGYSNRNVLVFTKDFHRFVYSFIDNTIAAKDDQGEYSIDDTNIYYKDKNIQIGYTIIEDTLIMITSMQTQKYIRTNEILPK